MAEPTTLYLLRHGEIDRPSVAQFDQATLTKQGRAQIHALAAGWDHPRPDVIYCSRLPRSVETAAICASVFRVPVRVEPGLEEWAATEMDVPQDVYRELERKSWADLSFENEYGESLDHATERIVRGLTVVANRHAGRIVLVSGHSILFALFLAFVRGERATETSKNRIAFGAFAFVDYQSTFRVVRDFSP